MKKLVLLGIFLSWFSGLKAQTANTSLDLDFSDPGHANRFNFIFDTGGELTKTVADGEMRLVLNKKEWHFFQVWVSPFAFIQNPYLNFRIKTDKPTPIRMWVNQGGGVEKTIFEETIQPGADFQTIARQIENVAPLTANINELNIDIGGYQVPPASFSATVVFDHFKMGEAAKPISEVYGKGYAEDFSGPLYAGWLPGEGYGVSKAGEALRMTVNRSVPVKDNELAKLPSLSFGGKVLDVKDNPYLNLDINGDRPFTFFVIVLDNFKTKKEFPVRVVPTGAFQQISVNLAGQRGLDLSKVEKIYFDFNREGFAFNASSLVDNLRIGEGAGNLPVMDAVADKKFYKNSGAREIQLTHILNAGAVTAAGASGLVDGLTVTPLVNGSAKLKFTPKAGAVGTEEITLTVQGAAGFASNTYKFKLTLENNLAPTLNAIADVQTEAKLPVSVRLSGISDGNATVQQALSFTVTSSDARVITGKVVYDGESPTAILQLNPLQKGAARVTVTVKDAGDGNNTRSVSFNATVNNTLNKAPTIAAVKDLEVYGDAGPSSLPLTGLGDGDSNKGNQVLTIRATSSNPAAVKNVSVTYTPYANTATLNYEPVAGATGASTITVAVTDNGGNGNNNGYQTTTLSFKIDVVKRPLTGYVAAMQKSVEGFGATNSYTVTEEVIDGIKTLVFDCKDKFYWDGVGMNLPEELDLSEYPYLTMEVFPVDQSTIHWIWFWDVTGARNTLNNREGDHIQRPVAGKWNKLVFDFSRPNDWVNNDTGQPINNKRINRILFDMHNADFNWPPPPNYTGRFMVRNIRVGSQTDFTPTYTATVNAVANQVAFPNLTSQAIALSGLSDGKGNAAGVTVSAANSNPAVVTGVEVAGVDAAGNARLTYSTGGSTGKSTITLTVAAAGSVSKSVSFDVNVLSGSGDEAATVAINLNQKFQKMYGFGTFSNSSTYSKMYTELMGGTAMRIGLIGNQLEEVNDNDDPNVLNMDALNYAALDWDYYRDLKERGVQSFILTSWSPPAWMKTSLTLDYKQAGYLRNTDETTNRLDYAMYEEFAESMVAVVKAFKQRSGIDLLAIGLQNEPTFHEPYPSAILDYNKFALLIKVVGRRFVKEGINTRLFLAEQVSGAPDAAANFYEDNHKYLKAVKDDPESDKYCDIFAIHSYASDGISPGRPRYDAWESYRDSAAAGNNPKDIWMTEAYQEYQTWQDALEIAGAIHGGLQYGNMSLWTQWAFEGQMAKKGQPTPMLYAMSNYARFIRPGNVRVGSSSSNQDIMASSFIDEATGRLSVVIVNRGNVPVSVKLDGAGLPTAWKMFVTAENRNLEAVNSAANGVFLLPARSVTTLEGTGALQMARVADVEVAADGRTHTVLVKGIGSATGSLEGLQLAVRNSNETVVPNIVASQIDANGTAVLTFAADKFVGTSRITLLLTDAAGNKVAQDFRIKTIGAGAGAQGSKGLEVFPNPSRGTFSLGVEAEGTVQITDLTGRVLQTFRLQGGNRTITATGLRKGAYVLVMHTAEGKRTARILIE